MVSQPFELRDIFWEAMERRTPQEQAEYLDHACQGRPELRARVEALLRANAEPNSFLAEPPPRQAALPDAACERPGTVIGPYKLLEQIGEGGFGLVFMAEQLHPFRRKVAVKVLKPGIDNRQVIARFEAERQALALMDHPSIAKILDAGTIDQPEAHKPEGGSSQPLKDVRPSGRPYFVLELVKGIPITDFCDQAQLPLPERLELLVSVCRAVQHAHQKGIIHRDIKPSNVLVTMQDGAPLAKIIDFGIAKALGQQLTDKTLFTGFAQLIGTPTYMSPEQAALSNVDVDTRSDIYSLGVLLYELLTGTTPFDKERLTTAGYDEMRRIIREEEPVRPSTRISTMGEAATVVSARRQSNPEALSQVVRGELDWIVMKALEKDRNRRYETAFSFAADVQRFFRDEPVSACPPSAWYRVRKLARRHRWALALAGVVVLALVVIAAGSLIAALFLNQALRDSEHNRQRAEGAEETAITEKRLATERLYKSLVVQARASRLTRSTGQRFQSLQAVAQAARVAHSLDRFPEARAELRTEAIAALCLPDLELVREGPSIPIGASGFAIDPAFERYAWADREGTTHVCRLQDDMEPLILPGCGKVDDYGGLQFSPDGRFLHQICATPRGLCSRLWDLQAPKPKAVLEDDHNALAFRPDGREMAVSYRNRTMCFLETSTGRELRRFTLDKAPADRQLAWNPKLPQLAIGTGASFYLINVDTGTPVKVGATIPKGLFLRWHPEGRLLAEVGQDLKIYLWDVATGRLATRPLEGHNNGGVEACFNSTGDRLLSTDWSNTWYLWDTRTGRLLLCLPGGGPWLSFSANDLMVGTAYGGKVRLYRFGRGEELRMLAHYNAASQEDSGFPGASIGSFPEPEDRLYAIPVRGQGIALMDISRIEEAALVPLVPDVHNAALRFDAAGALWTAGPAGLLRWPRTDDSKAGQRRYGPPQRLLSGLPSAGHDSNPDMSVVAIARFNDGAVLYYPETKQQVRLAPQDDVRCCALSPDGRWVATSSHDLRQGAGAKVWDARDGRPVKDLPVGGLGKVLFSPDSKWLLTTSGGPRLWAVGTWVEGPMLGGTPSNPFGAFSGDGKLLALGHEPGVVRLVKTDDGAEAARLTVQAPVPLVPCYFTRNGTKLVTMTPQTSTLYIFDLAAIRAGLLELSLDWDAPPLPMVSAAGPPPLSIQVDPGDIGHWAEGDALVGQAARQVSAKNHTGALLALQQAVQVAPGHAMAHNNLAWLLLTGPKELRDPARALSEARKAVALDHDEAFFHNTLGVALYRTEQFAEAIPALEHSLRRAKGQSDAFDLFFLAMCHGRLGDTARATDCLQRGVSWLQSQKSKLDASWLLELTEFQAEAEAVLAEGSGKTPK
jgi:serine/threonine protein kinase/WD40 repeat protein/Tfp pilus assembly protein PilF